MKSISINSCLISLLLLPALTLAQNTTVGAVLGYPDMILYNGKIVTMDDPSFTANPGTIVQAIAVRDDKILAIGTSQQMRALAGSTTQQIDLGGRTVLPGFILTHEHPTDWAWTDPTALRHIFPEGNEHLVVRFLNGNAEEQMANWEKELAEAVSVARPGQWILLSSDWGANFENMGTLFPNFMSLITTEKLDQIAPNNPVRVKNSWIDGEMNTAALRELRKLFPDAQLEGRGNRSEAGRQFEPDIMLHGKLHLNADLLAAEMELWAAHGVTVYGSSPYTLANLRALNKLDLENRMPGRFAWSYSGPNLQTDTLRFITALGGNGSDHLWNIGAQGERSGGTCTTLASTERVKAQESCSFEPGSEARRVLEDIVRAGGRISAMHTGGDKDIDYLLEIIETVSLENGMTYEQIRQRRHAFDHASGAPRPDQIPKLKELGMMVSMINTVIWENRTGYNTSFRIRNYGEEYVHMAVPRASVTKAGIMNTQEIDRALPHYMFYNIWVGMTRYNAGMGRALGPEEGTDLITQLKALTIWGAYYVLREDRLGSLEPGKLADLVVIDRDLLTIQQDDIPNVKVLMTAIGGKTVHLHPTLAAEVGATPVGPVTWPTRPLETRMIFKGPPPLPEYMQGW